MPFTGAKSNFLELNLLDHVLRPNDGGAAFAQPTGLWLSLHTGATANPTEAGASGDEVTGGNYARVDVSNEFDPAADLTGGGSSISQVTGTITFPTATEDWGGQNNNPVTDWGLWSANTGSPDLYYYGPFETSRVINSGDTLEITSGNFTIEER